MNSYNGEWTRRALLGSTTSYVLKGAPRFGHSHQGADIFIHDQRTDYLLGAGSMALLMGVLLIVFWLLVVGLDYLRGRRQNKDKDVNGSQATTESRRRRGRIVFAMSGMLVMVSAIAVIILWTTKLSVAAEQVGEGAKLTIDMMVDSQIPTTSFLLYSNDTFRVRERFIVGIERAFRDNRTNPSNSGGQAAYYASLLNLSATGSVYVYGDIDLKENANAVRKSLMRIDDAVLEPTLDLEDALDDIKDICWNVETAMDYTDWLVAKASVGASLAMLFSTLLFLLLPYIPHRGTQSRVSRFLSWVHGFVSWCMAPILILSIIVLILATCLVLVTGIVNADFCSGSGSLQASFSPGPSETFLTALVGNKVPQDSFKYRAAKYVMDGCRTPYTSPEYPLSFADAFQEQVEDCIQNVATLKDNIGYLEPVKLTRVIGYPMDLVFTDMRELKDMLVSAKESMQQMLRPLDCVQLHDLYVQNIEEATCQTSAQAFVGLFVCLLIMTVGCCLMLTFRVAILECKEEHNDACSQSGSTAQTHDKEKNTHRDDGDASVKLVVGVGIVIPDRSTHEFALDDDSLHSLPPPFRSSSSVEDGDEPEARLMESVSEFAQPLHIGGHTWYDI